MIDMAREQRNIHLSGVAALAVVTATGAAFWIVWPGLFSLPGELAERLAFTLMCALPVWLSVLAAIIMVGLGRRTSPEDIAGAAAGPPSAKLALRLAFLRNTHEQAFIALGAWLALAVLATGPSLALIPAAAALFVAGRVLFLIGYRRRPTGRAFGMQLTMMPTVLLYGLVLALGVSHLI